LRQASGSHTKPPAAPAPVCVRAWVRSVDLFCAPRALTAARSVITSWSPTTSPCNRPTRLEEPSELRRIHRLDAHRVASAIVCSRSFSIVDDTKTPPAVLSRFSGEPVGPPVGSTLFLLGLAKGSAASNSSGSSDASVGGSAGVVGLQVLSLQDAPEGGLCKPESVALPQ
jgi:hypothetical protein